MSLRMKGRHLGVLFLHILCLFICKGDTWVILGLFILSVASSRLCVPVGGSCLGCSGSTIYLSFRMKGTLRSFLYIYVCLFVDFLLSVHVFLYVCVLSYKRETLRSFRSFHGLFIYNKCVVLCLGCLFNIYFCHFV